MTQTTRFITWVYALLLHLYPRAFRREFGDEMQSVFADALQDAARNGWLALLLACAREIGGLARSAALERWRETKEGNADMDTRANTRLSSAERLSGRDSVLALFPFALGTLLLVASYPTPAPEWYLWLMAAAYLVPCTVLLGIGAVKGFPRWSYPYIGSVLFPAAIWMAVSLRRVLPISQSAEAQVLTMGLTLFVMFACIVLAGRFWRPLSPLYRGVRNDWTLFSFGLYLAAALTASVVDHEDYPVLTLAAVAPSLIMFLGALGFLRGNTKTVRALALLVAIVIAVEVRMLEGMSFYPAGIAIMGAIVFIPALLEFFPSSRPAEPAALQR